MPAHTRIAGPRRESLIRDCADMRLAGASRRLVYFYLSFHAKITGQAATRLVAESERKRDEYLAAFGPQTLGARWDATQLRLAALLVLERNQGAHP